jgi:gliding motility-associated-like protein
MKSATVNSIVPQALVPAAKRVLPAFIVQVGLYPFSREAILFYLLAMGVGLNTLAQNSMVGDGFGGRLWYNPTNYTVGSYSGYSICTADDCSGTNQLYGWGANNYGQLGYSLATAGFDVPTAIPNMTDVKYYSCGYSMAAIKNDNTGWVWGQYTPNYYPTQVITDVKFADGGIYYCSFVKNDGTVWSIGNDYYGEFGNGTQTESALVPVQMQGISNAVRVVCGFFTTYVLLADGTVRSVGSNTYGALGIGSFQDNSLTPVVVTGLNNIIDIKATTYFTLALSANGDVYAWGQLPDFTIATSPIQITSLANIVAISGCADGYHILALDDANTCYAWGSAITEAEGLPLGAGIDPTFVATDVIDIMAGEFFSYLVKSNGTLWAAGDSFYGSIWLNLANEVYGGADLYDGFVQLDPSLVPEACSVATQIALSSYSCEDAGTVEVIVSGGQGPYQYNIGNGNQADNVFTDLAAGEYDITITNAIGCEKIVNVVVDDGGMNYPTPALGPNQQWCQGTTAALNAGNAGATYLWSTGQTTQTIEVTDGGIYSVAVTMNGCTTNDEVQIDFHEMPLVNLGNEIASCEGTTTTLSAGNTGATYLWSTGQITQSIDVTNSGTYSVEVTMNGCTSEDEAQIELLPMPDVNLGNDITQCEGAEIILTAPFYNGATYLWSTGATTQSINVGTNDNFSVEVNWNGCTDADEVLVNVLLMPIVNLGNEITTCEGITTALDAGNTGATYLWSTGQTTQNIDVSSGGTYSVEVTMNGCTSEDEVQIELLPMPDVNLGNDITQCEGAEIILTAPFYINANYMWSNGLSSQSIDVTESGYYSVIVDLNGCTAEDELQINILPMPIVNLGDEITTCEGTTTTLNAGNTGATYLWSTGQTTQSIDVVNEGAYSVDVTMNGCTSEDQIQVGIIEPPAINLGADISECEGEGINITAPFINGATYQWSTGQTTQSIDVAISGAYSVEILLNGCTALDEIQIEFFENPFVNLGNDMEICEGMQMDLSAPYYNGASYLWNTGQTSQNIEVTESGSYSLEINWNGCITADEIFIEYFQIPVLDLGNDFAQCKGEEIILEATYVEGATYLWNTGDTGQSIVINDYGTYWCMSINGPCVYSDTIQYVQPVYECVEPFHAIWVPNAFTPDNDGNNDVFGVYGGGISNKNFELSIYNRWGDRIWTTTQPDRKWTGNVDDGEYYVPDGVYSYLVRYRFDNAVDDAILKGHVTVIR